MTWLSLIGLTVLLLAVVVAALVRHAWPSAEQQRFEFIVKQLEAERQISELTRATLAAMRQAVRDGRG